MSYLDEHRDKLFKKYNDYELMCDIRNYINGEGGLGKLLRQFFDENMMESKGGKCKLSPMEAMGDDKIMEIVLQELKKHPKMFNTGEEESDVRAFFRLSSKVNALAVSNFNPRVARDIYLRYFPDYQDSLKIGSLTRLNILDTSCGFGSRMCSVLLSGQNYHGTDPNKKLNVSLHKCHDYLVDTGIVSQEQVCDIRCQGSEEHIPEWDNKMDVMFTSPPYFNYEYYSDDNCASTQHYDNYKGWLRYYIVPTVLNIRKYLKTGGYAMINTKDFSWSKSMKLFTHIKAIFTNIGGFEHVEDFNITLGSRRPFGKYTDFKYKDDNIEGSIEPVMSFRKVK